MRLRKIPIHIPKAPQETISWGAVSLDGQYAFGNLAELFIIFLIFGR
jgi:hypothetical protein